MLAKFIRINSLRKNIALFLGLVCGILGAQVYLYFDPHGLTSSALERYEKATAQDNLLRELYSLSKRRQELLQSLFQTMDADIISEIQALKDPVHTTLKSLEKTTVDAEWAGAYKTLLSLNKDYEKTLRKSLSLLHEGILLKGQVQERSTKPIFDTLKELQLSLRTGAEKKNLSSLRSTLKSVQWHLGRVLPKKTLAKNAFRDVEGHMAHVTKPLTRLLTLTAKKKEPHGELETLQTLILNYFSAIQQLKVILLEKPQLVETITPQATLLLKFLDDLIQGMKENQREVFEGVYEESKAIQIRDVALTSLLVVICALFGLLLLWKTYRPLQTLSKQLKEETLNPTEIALKDTWKEIHNIVLATEDLRGKLLTHFQNEAHKTMEEDHTRMMRKLDMLAQSALELSKVSASLSKLPKVFDKKFDDIHTANDEARVHFRHMVKVCESLEESTQTLVKKWDDPILKDIEGTVKEVLECAHGAAIESQTLGLRFKSLIRTKEDTLEVSKLFSKAGARVNQLARSLQEDVKGFFEKLKGPGS